jgi:hypothetical protein
LALIKKLTNLKLVYKSQDSKVLNQLKPYTRNMIYFLIIILFGVTKSNSEQCEFRINELNIVDPKKPENREFIELKVSNISLFLSCSKPKMII